MKLFDLAYERNVVVYDADAEPGDFSRRLAALMKTVMRRNGDSSVGYKPKLQEIIVPKAGFKEEFSLRGLETGVVITPDSVIEDVSGELACGKKHFCLGLSDRFDPLSPSPYDLLLGMF